MGCCGSKPKPVYGSNGAPVVSQAALGNDIAAIARARGLGKGAFVAKPRTKPGQAEPPKVDQVKALANSWTGPKKFNKDGEDVEKLAAREKLVAEAAAKGETLPTSQAAMAEEVAAKAKAMGLGENTKMVSAKAKAGAAGGGGKGAAAKGKAKAGPGKRK